MSLTQVTNDELLDIEGECYDMIQTGLEDNALNLANIGFFDEFVENIFDYMVLLKRNQDKLFFYFRSLLIYLCNLYMWIRISFCKI